MSASNLIRLGGLATIVGGVIFAVNGTLVGLKATLLGLVSTVLFLPGMMAGIAALHFLQRERERYGYARALASAAAFVGVALLTVGEIFVEVYEDGLLGTLLLLVGLGLASTAIIVLGIYTLDVGVLSRWGGLALIAGNPLLAVLIILAFYGSSFSVGVWLVALPWVMVGFAVFRAAGQRTERPPRVR